MLLICLEILIFGIFKEKNKKKNKFNNLENWDELEAQQQKLFELSRNFNLPSETLKKNAEDNKELGTLKQTSSTIPEKKDYSSVEVEDNKKEYTANVFKKSNEDDDYENY